MSPGLRRMRAATPKGRCPFCLDPVAKSKGPRESTTCGEEECVRAYHRTYGRDRRRKRAA